MFKQHGIIKFYDKWRKSSRETLEILRAAYSEAIIKQSTGFEWHKMFKEWKENVKDDRRSGRPKTHSMCKNVKRQMAKYTAYSRRAKFRQENSEKYRDRWFRNIPAKTVLRVLTGDQNQNQFNILPANSSQMDVFIKLLKMNLGDPKTKRRGMQWKTKNTPRPKKRKRHDQRSEPYQFVFSITRTLFALKFTKQEQTVTNIVT